MSSTIHYLGHAGFIVEHRGVRVLIDPWFYPAFLQSWFPAPDNRAVLNDVAGQRFDYLYISHSHEDHFDARLLRMLDPHVKVLVANYRSKGMVKRFHALGFDDVTALNHLERKELGPGLALTMFLDTSHKEDSGVLLDLDGFTFLDLNDCNTSFSELPTGIDILAAQHSGAMWYPNCYDYPPDLMARKVHEVRSGLFDTLLRKVEITRATHYIPSAGPACFLDPALEPYNDPDTTIFPEWRHVAAEFDRIHPDKQLVLQPGDRLRIDPATRRVDREHGARVPANDTLTAYRERRRDEWSVFKSESDRPVEPEEIETYFSTLQRKNKHLVGDFSKDVQLVADGRMWGVHLGRLSEHFVIESEEPLDPEYVFMMPSGVLRLILDGTTGWEEALLSMRINLRRDPDVFDLTLLGLLRYGNEPAQTMQIVREQQNRATIDRDGLHMQRFCPHAGEDLAHATVCDGVIECPRHHWRWDARTGLCLSGGAIPLRVTVVDSDHPSLNLGPDPASVLPATDGNSSSEGR